MVYPPPFSRAASEVTRPTAEILTGALSLYPTGSSPAEPNHRNTSSLSLFLPPVCCSTPDGATPWPTVLRITAELSSVQESGISGMLRSSAGGPPVAFSGIPSHPWHTSSEELQLQRPEARASVSIPSTLCPPQDFWLQKLGRGQPQRGSHSKFFWQRKQVCRGPS